MELLGNLVRIDYDEQLAHGFEDLFAAVLLIDEHVHLGLNGVVGLVKHELGILPVSVQRIHDVERIILAGGNRDDVPNAQINLILALLEEEIAGQTGKTVNAVSK